MCHGQEVQRKRQSPEAAAAAMVRLISRECRVDIAPADMLAFINGHWGRFFDLAVDIHDGMAKRESAAKANALDTQ